MHEGVDTIFGYPGGAVIPLFDALYDCSDIELIRTCHEQGASHAADGYARSTGRPGVCIVTSGPGATNIITGLATAYMDSVPMIAITGQVGKNLLGKDSFQEIDITGLTMGITKHNYLVTKASDLKNIIREAFFLVNDRRPGPVLIDISKDVFMEEVKDEEYIPSERKQDLRHLEYLKEISSAAELIKNSKKPVIYAGGGVIKSGSWKLLKKLSEDHNIPVVNSVMGLGSYDRKSDLSYGIVGMHGDSDANNLCYESDVIIGIGVRFSDRAIGNRSGFTRNAAIIHIDVDETEPEKNLDIRCKILGDFNEILKKLIIDLDGYKNDQHSRNFEEIQKYEGFHPKNIIELLQNHTNNNTIVATDVGQHQLWTAKYWKFDRPLSFITSGGLGTMGFGMGAALGAKAANPGCDVLLITGDGSFRMNHIELLTLSAYKIPVTVVLFNNSALGMVRQWQNLFSNKRYSHTDINDQLDLEYLCKAYGINYYKSETMDGLKDSLHSIDFTNGINLLECILDKDIGVYPIVPAGQSINNIIED